MKSTTCGPWCRFLESLRINRAPIIDPKEMAKQEQQAAIDRLYPKP